MIFKQHKSTVSAIERKSCTKYVGNRHKKDIQDVHTCEWGGVWWWVARVVVGGKGGK